MPVERFDAFRTILYDHKRFDDEFVRQFFFFFQAEDGIRDYKVTGVQTCALPIFNKQAMRLADPSYDDEIGFTAGAIGFKGVATEFNVLDKLWNARVTSHIPLSKEIGRASCRERV